MRPSSSSQNALDQIEILGLQWPGGWGHYCLESSHRRQGTSAAVLGGLDPQ